ncbi:MAG TPA: hypothetical protein ENN67_04090 [Firmicutes bacterium]|nr:hypothetical protein [Bacillota bacterium]
MIQTRASVHGLTTAATIWVMASLGLVVGLGSYVLAITGAILVLVALQPLQNIEKIVKGKKSTFTYKVIVSECAAPFERILRAIQASPVQNINLKSRRIDEKRQELTFDYTDKDDAHAVLLNDLARTEGVDEVTSEKQ